MRVAMSRAREVTSPETRAGTIDTSRMPSRCMFSATGQVTVSWRSLRATITDTSQASRTRRSSTQGRPCIARQALSTSAREFTLA